jgi:hypothetical protein
VKTIDLRRYLKGKELDAGRLRSRIREHLAQVAKHVRHMAEEGYFNPATGGPIEERLSYWVLTGGRDERAKQFQDIARQEGKRFKGLGGVDIDISVNQLPMSISPPLPSGAPGQNITEHDTSEYVLPQPITEHDTSEYVLPQPITEHDTSEYVLPQPITEHDPHENITILGAVKQIAALLWVTSDTRQILSLARSPQDAVTHAQKDLTSFVKDPLGLHRVDSPVKDAGAALGVMGGMGGAAAGGGILVPVF